VHQTWVVDALQQARVARLGTVSGDATIRLVPICFAVIDGWVASAVDHKRKRTAQLRRLDDIEAAGTGTVLVDHYDEDWSRLWWILIRGRAEVHREHDKVAVAVIAALVNKYAQYRERPPAGAVYRIAIDDIQSWRSRDYA
jgi:PPOX class probable F420-dependent enzyme